MSSHEINSNTDVNHIVTPDVIFDSQDSILFTSNDVSTQDVSHDVGSSTADGGTKRNNNDIQSSSQLTKKKPWPFIDNITRAKMNKAKQSSVEPSHTRVMNWLRLKDPVGVFQSNLSLSKKKKAHDSITKTRYEVVGIWQLKSA